MPPACRLGAILDAVKLNISLSAQCHHLTDSAITTRRWRERRRRGVQLVHVEASPEAVQAMVTMGLVPADDESPETISQGVQDLLALLAAGRLKL